MADYNINAVTRRVVYTGSAGVGPYAFSFEILTQTDVDVYFNDTLLTITTDYTVTINANGTGSVTIVTGTNVPSTPDADDQITIVGARDIERVTDFVTAGDFRASAINEQLDALTIFDQQLAEADDRTVKAPVTDPTSIDMTLPKKADRASKFLLFSATGDVGVASTDTLTVSTLQAFTDYQVDTFTGDNTTVAFTLSAEPGQKGNTQVYFDGVYQAKANYSLVGTSITFTTAPATGVKVEVVHGQAASTYTPDDGSITFAKLATAAVDTDLTSVSASHDTLPTALATKTYVDAQIGSNNELSEVLANGNTSGGTNIVVSAGDSITTDTIAETTAAAGVTIDGVLVKDGEVDGRDVSADGTKLDTVETNADVTDTANVTAAGALMDSELTNITAVKALDQGVATTDTPTFAGIITSGNVDGRDVSVDGTKLDGIEANADVTDTANVTAAGALMDSELTNITAVKALDQGVATTDSPSFAGLTATTADINGGTIDGTVIGGSSAAAGTFTTLSATGNTTLGDAAGDVTQNKGGFAAQGTGLPGSGSGVEINFGLVAGEGTVQAFDRDGSAWEQLRLRGNQVAFDISGTEKMRIDSSGNVGVGTSSPSVKLELNNGGAGSLVTFTDGVATNFNFSTSGTVGTFGTDAGSTSLALKTAGSERMRIDSSGNVGIGISSGLADLLTVSESPGAAYQIRIDTNGGFSGGNYSGIEWTQSNSSQKAFVRIDHDALGRGTLKFGTSNGHALTIDPANSDAVLPATTEAQDLGSASLEWDNIYLQNAATVSDERRKENIADVTWATDFLRAVDPKVFTLKDTVIPATTEARQVTEKREVSRVETDIVDGKLVARTVTEVLPQPVFDEMPVVDEQGIAVAGSDGKPLMRMVPRMETVAVPAKTIAHSRPHTGVIAQQVKAAMDQVGLTDWAGYAYDADEDKHFVRYNEFVGVLLAGFKALDARIAALEAN